MPSDDVEAVMPRIRSEAEIAWMRRWVEARQAALYPEYEITVAVSKASPPPNGGPDFVVTRFHRAG
jgi:hypothetical protein